MGRTSTSYQTPRVKKGRRSSLLGLAKVVGKVGKRMLGPVSYGSRVSSYLNSPAARRKSYYLNSPVTRKRRSGNNYMAELTEYREYREVREVRWVKEGDESINRGQEVARTPDWKRRRGIQHHLGKVLARGKRFFVTPAKHKRRYFKHLSPDKLTGGWRGDLAKLSREWEVIVLDTNVLMHHLGVVEDLLSCNGPMIYIAAIVCTELDGLKKNPEPEMEQKARRASRWVQRALRERKIATQTALEEEEAKSRWPQEISGSNYGDVTLLATVNWLVDVKGVQVDKAVLVTNDVIEDVGALREQIRVCDVQYLKSKISD